MNNNFNNVIKDHVERHHHEVDPQEIWDGILVKQKAKPNRRLWFLPLFFGLLFSIIWYSRTEETPAENLSASVESYPAEMIDNHHPQSQHVAVSSNKYPATTSTASLASENEDLTRSNQKVQEAASFDSDQVADNSATEIWQTKTPQTTTTQSSPTESLVLTPARLQLPVIKKNSDENFGLVIDDLSLIYKPQLSTKTPPLASRSFLIVNESNVPLHNGNLSTVVSYDAITPVSQYGKWQLSLSGGYGSFGKSIAAQNNSSELIYQRSVAETALEAISTGLLISYDLTDKFSLSSGILLQRVNEKFSWSGTYYEDINGDFVINPQNFSSSYYEQVDRDLTIYNSYDYLDVPLYLSYDLAAFGKMRTSIFGGLSYNLATATKGIVLDNQGLPIPMEEGTLKVGVRSAIGISALFPISEKIGVHMNGMYSLRNVTSNDLLIRYDYKDVNLGLTYKFN